MFAAFKPTGQGTVQYVALIALVIGAFVIMSTYISRGFWGHWKSSGDSFGQGRQVTAGSRLCAYAQINYAYGVWYDDNCYHHHWVNCPPGDKACEDTAKFACAQNYCCEDNTEPPGHSNCP